MALVFEINFILNIFQYRVGSFETTLRKVKVLKIKLIIMEKHPSKKKHSRSRREKVP
jgi:hypothetical protein